MTSAATAPNFGDLLRRHRIDAGLTQEALAERAGISVRGISDLERGTIASPRRETLDRLLTALDLTDAAAATLREAARRRARAVPTAGTATRSYELPLPPTPIIGRDGEAAEIRGLLLRSNVRLLTLTGPGGVGKTRLALRVAAGLAADFTAGACFVSLAPVTDPTLVASTIAGILGVRETRGRSLDDSLRRFLHDLHLLLVLDNFEQILAAAPLVADLLGSCPRLKVIATSRSALHLRGEQEYPLDPLPVPAAGGPPTASAVGDVASAQLFAQRARSARPDFALTDANAAAIAEVCRRLDGLPLAIELAAARIKVLSPVELQDRLAHRLAILTSGARDLPHRLRTMRDAIAWSYDLLPPPDQALFRRLGIFAGGFTLDAAEAVGGEAARRRGGEEEDSSLPPSPTPVGTRLAAPPPPVLDGLAELLSASMIRRSESPNGATRFGMLETVREFAIEQLEAMGEIDDVSERHATYFVELAEGAALRITGPGQKDVIERLETEHDNARAALGRALARGDAETGLRLAGALWRFWQYRGHLKEGRDWLDRLFAIGATASPAVRARALNGAGALALRQGDFPGAEPYHDEAVALFRRAGDKTGTADSLNFVGIIAEYRADYPRAKACYEECLALRRGLGDRRGIGVVLGNLGIAANDEGDFPTAEYLLQESLVLRREVGDRWTIANGLNNLGIAARGLGDYERAERLQAESRGLYELLGDAWGTAHAMHELARIAECRGDLARAATIYRDVLVRRHELGDRMGLARGYEGLARTALGDGSAAFAARFLAVATQLRTEIGSPVPPADRPVNDLAATTARSVLGPEAFAAAWTAGTAMSLDEAIGEALATGYEAPPSP